MTHYQRILAKSKQLPRLILVTITMFLAFSAVAYAAPQACGSGENTYTPSIELGCVGKGDSITDFAFAMIRFLSLGVGLVIVGSMTYAGIQYTGSRGDPNAHAQAVKRIQSNVTALLIFIFLFAIINYVVPGALLK